MRSFMKKLLGNSGAQRKEGSHSHTEEREQERHGRNHSDLEEKYRTVLGVTDADSPSTIKEKYRDLIARYHPDKLQHLGGEFQALAEQKSKAIIEAYEFLRKRYNM
jgi:DnaJ like chaperone protein